MGEHITMFDQLYPEEKQAEGIAISEAVAYGKCNECNYLSQCESNIHFRFPPSV